MKTIKTIKRKKKTRNYLMVGKGNLIIKNIIFFLRLLKIKNKIK